MDKFVNLHKVVEAKHQNAMNKMSLKFEELERKLRSDFRFESFETDLRIARLRRELTSSKQLTKQREIEEQLAAQDDLVMRLVEWSEQRIPVKETSKQMSDVEDHRAPFILEENVGTNSIWIVIH